ncbi:hypothetical protein [Saccharothrix lopnurensis]|uniref:Uncharacterized protein n=1 Tax=Saccharothrix lopnurensis TaxID=1670621 RepID=A0ABW1PCA7_9PSEU
MLYVVLLLVLVALGLLVPALTSTQSHWAWLSVGASGAAAVVLVLDWWRRRRRSGVGGASVGPAGPPVVPVGGRDRGGDFESAGGAAPAAADRTDFGGRDGGGAVGGGAAVLGGVEPGEVEPGGVGPGEVESGVRSDDVEPDDVEPGEEDADAADSLVVADLTDEVRVLDERPRYHLVDCPWLGARDSLALPIDEARRLGFTPCAVCAPDASLAARARGAREEP